MMDLGGSPMMCDDEGPSRSDGYDVADGLAVPIYCRSLTRFFFSIHSNRAVAMINRSSFHSVSQQTRPTILYDSRPVLGLIPH